ncbi:MAG: PHP domain-containing protein, partial [Clostridia bacterium]|nr:PHP domain-containing protein [Clostridia bacterium]
MYRISDFHMHSSFSDDSDATPRSMIERSIALGLPSICFTEHNDFDYPLENGRTIFNIDLPEYIKSIESLKTEYGRQIDIGIGIEQGLMK